ncbi:MAG TPA: site-2 protease family protein [Thermomicrobiales bacterium]|nr:site-2 protease family protein [Thermomicrobiales bacterium]
MLHDPDRHKLHFVSRGSPNSGIYIIMLLLLLGQLLNNHTLPPTKQIVTVLLCFVVAISVHELMHAVVALRLGDTTAERQGRVTLNPVSHFEPFGFMGMVLISLGYNFIGWGKPVPVNPSQLRVLPPDQRHRGMALVALAGPLTNVVLAALAAVVVRNTNANTSDFGYVAYWFFWVNVLLASFNAIPLPPLDGYKIMVGILPRFWTPVLAPLERYGFLILFLIFFLGGRIGSSLTSEMIDPVRNLLVRLLL